MFYSTAFCGNVRGCQVAVKMQFRSFAEKTKWDPMTCVTMVNINRVNGFKFVIYVEF